MAYIVKIYHKFIALGIYTIIHGILHLKCDQGRLLEFLQRQTHNDDQLTDQALGLNEMSQDETILADGLVAVVKKGPETSRASTCHPG